MVTMPTDRTLAVAAFLSLLIDPGSPSVANALIYHPDSSLLRSRRARLNGFRDVDWPCVGPAAPPFFPSPSSTAPLVCFSRTGQVGMLRTRGRNEFGKSGGKNLAGVTGTVLQAVPARSFLDDDSFRSVPPVTVLEAVQSASDAGGRVIASDLAAAAGISLSQARRYLQILATLTGAGMAVTDGGELVYTFPYNLQGALKRSSARYRARALAKRAWPGLFYAVRMSFGVMLLVSLLAVFASLAALSAAGEAGAEWDEDDRRRRRGGGPGDYYGGRGSGGGGGVHFHFGPSLWNSWFGPSPFDMFYYRPYYGYYGRRRPPLYGTYTIDPWGGGPIVQTRRDELMGRISEREAAARPSMSFLEAFYSYVFGDGDPNGGIDERLLIGAAAMIRANGGAVTAEQLAPFLPDPPSPDDFDDDDDGYVRAVDETYVLPIVTKLGGEPVVTDDGDIVYIFPEMAKTTTDGSFPDSELSWLMQQTKDEVEDAAAVRTVSAEAVQEEELGFSLAEPGQKTAAAALGLINLAGALALGKALANPKLSGVKLIGMLGLVQRSFLLILSYAVLYNAIPLARYVRLRRQNERIRRRNSDRRRWVTQLRSAVGGVGGSIGRKLRAARGMARQIRRVDKETIVFDSTEDAAKTGERKEKRAMEEFDDLLNEED